MSPSRLAVAATEGSIPSSPEFDLGLAANTGQTARLTNAAVAATVCATELPWIGWGNAATRTVDVPPVTSNVRPAGRAWPSPHAVTT
jgi:hypothetical protein